MPSRRVLLILFLLIVSAPRAEAGKYGLGIILGTPTGVSFKGWLSNKNAIDGALAWSLGNNNSFHLHVDYLWHKYNVVTDNKVPIDLFFGVGARLLTKVPDKDNIARDEARLGVRFPIGLRHQFGDPPIEVFVEFALVMNLVASTGVDFDLGIGARYFF